MKKWLYRITITVMVLIAAYTVYQRSIGKAIPLFFGYGTATIASGSMEPEYPVGSLIIVHEESGYEVGDVIVFQYDSIPTMTHRIVDIQDGSFVTQGDANAAPEPHTTDPSAVIGKVIYVIPWVGAIMYSLQNPLALASVGAGIAVIGYLYTDVLTREKECAEENEDSEESQRR